MSNEMVTIDLQVRADGGVPVVNSRVVAKHFGKRHDNVLRDIDVLAHSSDLRDVDIAWFSEKMEKHPTVTDRVDRSFNISKDGFTLLAMGWTGAKALRFKIAYIAAFNEMEAALRSAPTPVANLNDPHTLRAALLGYTERVILLEGENAALGAKVERLAPKADAHDLLAAKIGEAGLMETSRALTGRAMALIEWMKDNKWIYRSNYTGPWLPYADKLVAGYLVVRERAEKHREDRSHPQTMVTPKGRAKLAEILSQGDLLTGNRKRSAA